jgi:glucan biosynthesis protein C
MSRSCQPCSLWLATLRFPRCKKRGSGLFLRDKLVRIGIPWLLAVLLIAPPVTYLTYFSRGVPVSLLQFWRTDFWGDMYQQAVYWFLGVLLLMFVVLAVLHRANDRFRSIRQQASEPSATLFCGFAAFTTLFFLLMNLTFPLDSWLRLGYLLLIQPLRVPLYVAYFSLGLYAYTNAWFTADGYRPALDTWALICSLSGALYLSYRLGTPPAAQTTLALKAANAALFNVFCLSSLLTGVAFFQRRAGAAGSLWASLAASSYSMYYVHPVLVYPLAYVFLGIGLPLMLKAVLVTGLAIVLSWGLSVLLLKRIPVLARVF